jgi:hypothetical protein
MLLSPTSKSRSSKCRSRTAACPVTSCMRRTRRRSRPPASCSSTAWT